MEQTSLYSSSHGSQHLKLVLKPFLKVYYSVEGIILLKEAAAISAHCCQEEHSWSATIFW